MSSQRKILLIAAAVGIPVVLYLAFVTFGVQTLFIDDKVNEAGPQFDLAAADDATNDVPTDDPAGEASEASSEVMVLSAGEFVDRSHPAKGVAEVLNDGTEQRFLRFEDFEVDNGPDLFVYLTTADAAADASEFGRDGEFVNLGVLKGNIGSQNYEIPADVDLSEYDTVVIWCRRFAVAFAAADLT
ncbi:MAG: DM13 domain-containing protein [Acidimicrobiales bacterium]